MKRLIYIALLFGSAMGSRLLVGGDCYQSAFAAPALYQSTSLSLTSLCNESACLANVLKSGTQQKVAHLFRWCHQLERNKRIHIFLYNFYLFSSYFFYLSSLKLTDNNSKQMSKNVEVMATALMVVMHILAKEYGWASIYAGLHYACSFIPSASEQFSGLKNMRYLMLLVLRVSLNGNKAYYSRETSGCVLTKASYALNGIADRLCSQ